MNIVFSDDSDFDLAGKEGTHCPENFNCYKIHECHPCTLARLLRLKEHDCYALSVIMHTNGVPTKLVHQVQDGKDKLSEIAHTIIRLQYRNFTTIPATSTLMLSNTYQACLLNY